MTYVQYNIYAKLTKDNTTTAGIIYKELYGCKWYPLTMTKNILFTPAFSCYKYCGLMMACIGRN